MIYDLPVAPTAKGRPRVVRTKTGLSCTYSPDRTVDAEERIRWHLRQQGAEKFAAGTPLGVVLKFYVKPPQKIKCRFPITRPDIDQFVKLVLDAGNGILWDDDSQVVSLVAHKIYADDGNPHIVLVVAERGPNTEEQ